MDILYNSEAITKCIRDLFDCSSSANRRVILVAYIGRDYAKFLRRPRGIEIVCNPTPGATSAIAVSELQRAGALMRFSDNLHMKVYWSEKRGCVVASANLSKNALGIRGLKEAGVLIKPGVVKIDELLKTAKPYEVTNENLRKLKKDEDAINEALAKTGKRWSTSGNDLFCDWSKRQPEVRHSWKLGWWDTGGDFAQAGKEWVKTRYGRNQPDEFLNVTRTQAKAKDWFLSFQVERTGFVRRISWLYVHHVVRVRKSESAHERGYPYQAIQALPLAQCPEPPFRITPSFRNSFATAIKKYGISRIKNEQTLVPSSRLLACINRLESVTSSP
jgi:hypothetical protein